MAPQKSRGERHPIPGVTYHAMERQQEHWGSVWSRTTWLDVVRQIVERTAVLVRSVPPSRGNPSLSEVWLVDTPDGSVRVVWRPQSAVIVSVLANGARHNSQHYAREVLGRQRPSATPSAENTNRTPRQRAEAEWRRAMRDEDSDA